MSDLVPWPFVWPFTIHEGVLAFDIEYPRSGAIQTVEIGLMDVRAADAIRITYDFERDGWSILQASRFEWSATDPVMDSDWQEVAFIKAWAREQEATDA